MLSITELIIQSKEKKELAQIGNVSLMPGTISLVVGKNGSGKTSFLHGLFLHPSLESVARNIFLDNQDISNISLIEIYKNGLHYVPQHLTPLPGVSFISFLHIAYENKFSLKMSLIAFLEKVKEVCAKYNLPQYIIEKNVHENLSGGERKMQELIQVVVLKPKYLFLDEIDAGLDRDAKDVVANTINKLKNEGTGIVLVSHSFEFTELVAIDSVYLMNAGKIVRTGDTSLLGDIKKDGFTE